MSANDGGPAFPREDYQADDAPGQRGMSMRDYFAAKAIAIVARQADLDNAGTPELAAACYEFADQLLEERETPLLERTSHELRADLADNRASRYEVLLRRLCDACDKGDVGQTDALRTVLDAANAQLRDDEIPF